MTLRASAQDNQTLTRHVTLGDSVRASAALAAGANPNTRDEAGRSLLMVAAAQPHASALLEVLWQFGASPYLVDRLGRRALDLADASNGGWLKSRLDSIPTPTETDTGEWTEWVLQRDRQSLCAAFNVFRQFPSGLGAAPLLLYSMDGQRPVDVSLLKLLAESGLPLDGGIGQSRLPLSAAAALDERDALDVLLSAGANPNAEDSFSRPPLIHAILNDRPAHAERLLDAGAAANPPALAVQPVPVAVRGGSNAIVGLLLAKGASANQADASGASSLALAVERSNTQAVRQLLTYQADPNGRDANRRPALVVAAQNRQPDLVRLLLDKHADPALTGPDGRTALGVLNVDANLPALYQPRLGPMLADLSEDQPVDVEVLTAAEAQVFAEDLAVDALGGYLVPINAQINLLLGAARRESRRRINEIFGTQGGTAQLDQQVQAREALLAGVDGALRDQASRIASLQAQRAASVSEGVALRTRVQASREEDPVLASQLANAVARLRGELETLRKLRASLRQVEIGIEKVQKDFSDSMVDPMMRWSPLKKEIAALQDASHAALTSIEQDLQSQQQDFSIRRADLQRSVNLAEEALARLRAERAIDASLAESRLKTATDLLREHLRFCKVIDEQTTSADGKCHVPSRCDEMKARNTARESRAQALKRAAEADPDIRARVTELEQVRAAVAPQLIELELEARTAAENGALRKASAARDFQKQELELRTELLEIQLSYEERVNALRKQADAADGRLRARYGDKYPEVYSAAATLAASIRATRSVTTGASLAGWMEILSLRSRYQTNMEPAPPGLDGLQEAVLGLNVIWAPFTVRLNREGLLAAKILETDKERAALTRLLAESEKTIASLQLQQIDHQRDLEDLLRQRRSAQPEGTSAQRAEFALEQLNELWARLLQEAFRPASMRSLGPADFRAMEVKLREELTVAMSGTTSSLSTVSLLEQVDALPAPSLTSAGEAISFQDIPKAPPTRFVPLTMTERERLIAAWAKMIDFNAQEWREVSGASSNDRLLKVFRQAVLRHANLDRADFSLPPYPVTSAYRFVTSEGIYWIGMDGSLRNYMERDQDEMFKYSFRSPKDSMYGRDLREAYVQFAQKVSASFPTLPDAQKEKMFGIEAAFRALDRNANLHQFNEGMWRALEVTDSAVSAIPGIGQWYSLYRVVSKIAAWDETKDLSDVNDLIVDALYLMPFGDFFAYPARASMSTFADGVRKGALLDFVKETAFHRDRLAARLQNAGQYAGLETQKPVLDELQRLKLALAHTEWTGPAPAGGPTPHSRWSVKVPPGRLASKGIALRRISNSPVLYTSEVLTLALLKRLGECLGIPIQALTDKQIVTGSLTFGSAVHQTSGVSCIVFSAGE